VCFNRNIFLLRQPIHKAYVLPLLEFIMTEEEKLIKACLEGDKRAHSALYDRFARLMFGVCQRYSRTREDAEDVLHMAFVKVFNNLGHYRGKGSFEGWIRRIMVNTAIDYYRSIRQLQFVSADEIPDTAEEDTHLNEEGDDDEYYQTNPKEILKLMQALPNGYRIVLNLYAVEGQTHKEISELLGISEGSSKSQLFKARRYLKAMLIEKKLVKQVYNQVYEKG
jgi:RNA polymerase sigma factor (sigma-70 family)